MKLIQLILCVRETPHPKPETREQVEGPRKTCLVANRATLPQKWPPPPENVVDSCELTATNAGGRAAEGGGAARADRAPLAHLARVHPTPYTLIAIISMTLGLAIRDRHH